MGKLYTLDEKLLTDAPEIRVGDKCYPVDNRKKTVARLMKLTKDREADESAVDDALKLALGEKAFRELDALEMPFPAYQKLFELVLAAMTGEEPEAVAARFQDAKGGT